MHKTSYFDESIKIFQYNVTLLHALNHMFRQKESNARIICEPFAVKRVRSQVECVAHCQSHHLCACVNVGPIEKGRRSCEMTDVRGHQS